MTNEELFNLDPIDLLTTLMRITHVSLPEALDTPERMREASKATLKLGGWQSYLEELSAYAKCMVRDSKRTASTEEWQDMVDRKEAVDRVLKAIEAEYSALSRAATMEMDAKKSAQFEDRAFLENGEFK